MILYYILSFFSLIFIVVFGTIITNHCRQPQLICQYTQTDPLNVEYCIIINPDNGCDTLITSDTV